MSQSSLPKGLALAHATGLVNLHALERNRLIHAKGWDHLFPHQHDDLPHVVQSAPNHCWIEIEVGADLYLPGILGKRPPSLVANRSYSHFIHMYPYVFVYTQD